MCRDWARVDRRGCARRGHLDRLIVGKNLTNENADLADNASLGAEVVGRPQIVINQPRTIWR